MAIGSTIRDYLAIVRDTLQVEADSILSLIPRLGDEVGHVLDLLYACKGRLIVTGMGKTGCIARKAAATFSSTGTPAGFIHPSEALHGDLGIVTDGDVVLALSYSGETEELLVLIPFFVRRNIPLIALTGSRTNSLARRSSLVIEIAVASEADLECPAPTCSTTTMLALCDALAVALMRRRGLTKEQFAVFHPGGSLGRRLLLTVGDLMHTGARIPLARPLDTLQTAIVSMTRGALGSVFVVDDEQRLQGILTDGDLRRIFQKVANPLTVPVGELMHRSPKQTVAEDLAVTALQRMKSHSITILPVVNENQEVVGAIHLHDLIKANLV